MKENDKFNRDKFYKLFSSFDAFKATSGLFPGSRVFIGLHYLFHYPYVPGYVLMRYEASYGYRYARNTAWRSRNLDEMGLIESVSMPCPYLANKTGPKNRLHFNLSRLGIEYYSFCRLFLAHIMYFAEVMDDAAKALPHKRRTEGARRSDRMRAEYLSRQLPAILDVIDIIPPPPPPPDVVVTWPLERTDIPLPPRGWRGNRLDPAHLEAIANLGNDRARRWYQKELDDPPESYLPRGDGDVG